MKIPTEAERIIEAAEARARRFLACRETPRPPAKRHHPKRHSENRERSRVERAKAKRATEAQDKHNARRSAIRVAVRAYYAGEIPDLSSIADLLEEAPSWLIRARLCGTRRPLASAP